MLDGNAVAALEKSFKKPHVVTVDGRDRLVVPEGWQEKPFVHPSPEALQLGTLTGLVDYLKTNVDKATLSNLLVHVKDPGTVEIRGNVESEDKAFRRVTALVASTALVGGAPFPFGQFLDAESFFIRLQSQFVVTDERDTLLTFIAAIKENSVKETVDDGVAQQVKVAGGVVLVGEAKVPNPVTLQPFRTFREVRQPASKFVLRAQAGGDGPKPKLALFEADGAAWKLEAVDAIAKWLVEQFALKMISVAVVA